MTELMIPSDEVDAWHEQRRKGIGSTDAAAILGLSPWSTPFDVWQEKTGERPTETAMPLRMYLGKRLQDTVGDLYVYATGRRIRADNRQHHRREFPWQYAHLDFRVLGDPTRIIECKTAFRDNGWGDDGTTDIPVHYWCQVQHEMAVTGASWVDVAVLFGHRDFRVYPIPRDDDFIVKLTLAEEEFWTLYVVPKVPPPVDHTQAATRFLNRKHPTAKAGAVIPATPEQAELVDRYRRALEATNAAIEERDRLKNRIIQVIGSNEGLRGGDFEITYRNVKPGDPVIVYPTVMEWTTDMLRALAADIDPAVVAADMHGSGVVPDDIDDIEAGIKYVIASNTVPGRKGYRRFDFDDRKGQVED